MEKILAIYKPKGLTSHDVVQQIRNVTGIKTVGHAGTLDPLARGVLVIGIGREATRELRAIVGEEKEYLAAIQLGAQSSTDDSEGAVLQRDVPTPPAEEDVEKAVIRFQGTIRQVPPAYSAVHLHGVRAYQLARQGKTVALGEREVVVRTIKVVRYAWPRLELRVVTGPGVYIRSLARDIGYELGTGGYLLDLERTRVGKFTKQDALTLSQFAQLPHIIVT